MLLGHDGTELASIDRAFRGFGREVSESPNPNSLLFTVLQIFTDTGQYEVDFRSHFGRRPLSVDEKAVSFHVRR